MLGRTYENFEIFRLFRIYEYGIVSFPDYVLVLGGYGGASGSGDYVTTVAKYDGGMF